MFESILVAVHPRYVKDIIDGIQFDLLTTISPTIPRPFKCYLYCNLAQHWVNRVYLTKENTDAIAVNGKVFAECIITDINKFIAEPEKWLTTEKHRSDGNSQM